MVFAMGQGLRQAPPAAGGRGGSEVSKGDRGTFNRRLPGLLEDAPWERVRVGAFFIRGLVSCTRWKGVRLPGGRERGPV